MKTFCAKHRVFDTAVVFQESSAPSWLTGKGVVKGSTMDNSWFFKKIVLALEVGQRVDTEFHQITRIA